MSPLKRLKIGFLALFLIMVFSMTLFACGGGGGGGDDPATSQSDSNQWGTMAWDEGQWG